MILRFYADEPKNLVAYLKKYCDEQRRHIKMNLVIANLYFSQYEQNCKGNDGFLTPSKLLTYVPDYFTTCSLYGNWLVMIVFFMDYSIQMFFSTN